MKIIVTLIPRWWWFTQVRGCHISKVDLRSVSHSETRMDLIVLVKINTRTALSKVCFVGAVYVSETHFIILSNPSNAAFGSEPVHARGSWELVSWSGPSKVLFRMFLSPRSSRKKTLGLRKEVANALMADRQNGQLTGFAGFDYSWLGGTGFLHPVWRSEKAGIESEPRCPISWKFDDK